ncbi:hypothetical protein C4D60_Mb10t05810 [Musa balbisiana]|uniref:Uncharacterized protein n=1 Tax=Musa balbisiana TaxID=52838 RepID=A0A4S8IWB0_MUSBA|nr:hypothetical protein C4D60_Mb10t05810 [Musa balbisiana]
MVYVYSLFFLNDLDLITDVDDDSIRNEVDVNPVLIFEDLQTRHKVREEEGESTHVSVRHHAESQVRPRTRWVLQSISTQCFLEDMLLQSQSPRQRHQHLVYQSHQFPKQSTQFTDPTADMNETNNIDAMREARGPYSKGKAPSTSSPSAGQFYQVSGESTSSTINTQGSNSLDSIEKEREPIALPVISRVLGPDGVVDASRRRYVVEEEVNPGLFALQLPLQLGPISFRAPWFAFHRVHLLLLLRQLEEFLADALQLTDHLPRDPVVQQLEDSPLPAGLGDGDGQPVLVGAREVDDGDLRRGAAVVMPGCSCSDRMNSGGMAPLAAQTDAMT